jgi:hypothetical protein
MNRESIDGQYNIHARTKHKYVVFVCACLCVHYRQIVVYANLRESYGQLDVHTKKYRHFNTCCMLVMRCMCDFA